MIDVQLLTAVADDRKSTAEIKKELERVRNLGTIIVKLHRQDRSEISKADFEKARTTEKVASEKMLKGGAVTLGTT